MALLAKYSLRILAQKNTPAGPILEYSAQLFEGELPLSRS